MRLRAPVRRPRLACEELERRDAPAANLMGVNLRGVEDWRRFAGRKAKVLAPQLGGRVEIEIVGLEGESGSEAVIVRDARGTEHRIPLA